MREFSTLVEKARGRVIAVRLKLLGHAVGSLRIGGRAPTLNLAGKVRFGRRVHFRSIRLRQVVTCGKQGALDIGDDVFINDGVGIFAGKSVSIGRDTKLANNVAIYDTNFHEIGEGEGVLSEPVVIGRNVWIARDCIILPGVTIGDHSVVGAGSVVVRDVPPRHLAAGNPAKIIREIAASEDYRRK